MGVNRISMVDTMVHGAGSHPSWTRNCCRYCASLRITWIEQLDAVIEAAYRAGGKDAVKAMALVQEAGGVDH